MNEENVGSPDEIIATAREQWSRVKAGAAYAAEARVGVAISVYRASKHEGLVTKIVKEVLGTSAGGTSMGWEAAGRIAATFPVPQDDPNWVLDADNARRDLRTLARWMNQVGILGSHREVINQWLDIKSGQGLDQRQVIEHLDGDILALKAEAARLRAKAEAAPNPFDKGFSGAAARIAAATEVVLAVGIGQQDLDHCRAEWAAMQREAERFFRTAESSITSP